VETDRHPAGSLAIVADGQLSVAALAALVVRSGKYRVVHRDRGIEQVRTGLRTYNPAIAVVESRSALRPRALQYPGWAGRLLLLLDPEDDPAVFLKAVRVRGDGYLSRIASRERFEQALLSLRSTGGYLDPDLMGRIVWAMKEAGPISRIVPSLSPRERDIVIRIARGRGTKEIAREYAISPKTVGNHINNIYQKLNLNHRGELVLYAVQEGLMTLSPTQTAP
jgi:DNA-binding NarL/FixJ family response regulator